MEPTITRERVLRLLQRELKRKNIRPPLLREAEEQIRNYVEQLELSMAFSTTVDLQAFISARR